MVFIVVALAGPLLTPYAPTTQHTNALLIPPAWNDNGSILHVLGTDALGRDMLTRLFYGTQVTLFSSIATVFIALGLGVAGANLTQVFLHNILPNMVELLIVQGTLAISVAILDISALGFLNLGAQTLMPELGVMIAEGLSTVYIAPWNILLPGLSIFLMVLSINIVGDGLRSALRNRLTH